MAKSKIEMNVQGMTCQGCVRSIENKLGGMSGVSYTHVNLGAGTVAVEFDDARVNAPALIAAVEQIGFSAAQSA